MAKDEDEDESTKNKQEGEGSSEEGLAPPKKSKKKLIIILAVVGLIVVGGGVGAALYFTGVLSKSEALTEQKTAEELAAEAEKRAKPVFYPLGDLLVNLSGEGKRPNYLKVKISLELADEKDVPQMDNFKPRIVDNFQIYLRELRIEDLRGSAGLYRLREALLLRVSESVQPIRVRDVLFQEMLIQ